jgi:hypothetical protein
MPNGNGPSFSHNNLFVCPFQLQYVIALPCEVQFFGHGTVLPNVTVTDPHNYRPTPLAVNGASFVCGIMDMMPYLRQSIEISRNPRTGTDRLIWIANLNIAPQEKTKMKVSVSRF